VARRETEDDGFSQGWGFHMLPSERYWVDSHCHFNAPTADEGREAITRWFERLTAWRLGQFVGIGATPTTIATFAELGRDPRLIWLLQLRHDNPDLAACRKALDLGAGGLKLHNAPIITTAADYHVWENEAWAAVFAELDRRQKVVLWHVTQRMTASAYNGGGLQAYWGEGRKRGVSFTNEDLLQAHLRLVRAYPHIPFIGAHQHYLGLERLDSLLRDYPNLYIDTSVGGIVRWGDELYPEDRERWADFVVRHADRILFGTDSGVGSTGTLFEVNVQAFLNHARFVHQLHLPDTVLQKVAWANAARLYGREELPSARRSSVRP